MKGLLGMFSDTILKWRDPLWWTVYLKEDGILIGAGRSLSWSAYKGIKCWDVHFDEAAAYSVIQLTPKDKK